MELNSEMVSRPFKNKRYKRKKIGDIYTDIPSKPYRDWFLLWTFNMKCLSRFTMIDKKYLAINAKTVIKTRIQKRVKYRAKTPTSVADSSYVNLRFKLKC